MTNSPDSDVPVQPGTPQHPAASPVASNETTPLPESFAAAQAAPPSTAHSQPAAQQYPPVPRPPLEQSTVPQPQLSPNAVQHGAQQASTQHSGYSQPGLVGTGAAFGAVATTHQLSSQRPVAPQKGRSGTLVAGIAIGALLGALVGGGTAALVSANMPGQSQTSTASPSGTITLNNTDEVNPISAVASIATPSVVTISVKGTQAAGSGSGVIYSADGYIITNSHVATLEGQAGSDPAIRVRLSDGRVFDGKLVGNDPFADIAVIKIDGDNLTPIKLGDSERLNVGDQMIVIGAPLNLPNTVTSGVVSALNRGISVGTANLPDDNGTAPKQDEGGSGSPWGFDFEGPNSQQKTPSQSSKATVTLPVIQTDASINPGNSGGALLNSNAELVGINVAIASNGDAQTAGSDGLGFAIPVAYATRVADAIISGKQPSHGLFGATVGDSSQDTDADANHAGALLTGLTRGGAAEGAGLKTGDVVTSINGRPVDSGTSLSALVRMEEGGSSVTITYTRNGVAGETQVTLGTLQW